MRRLTGFGDLFGCLGGRAVIGLVDCWECLSWYGSTVRRSGDLEGDSLGCCLVFDSLCDKKHSFLDSTTIDLWSGNVHFSNSIDRQQHCVYGPLLLLRTDRIGLFRVVLCSSFPWNGRNSRFFCMEGFCLGCFAPRSVVCINVCDCRNPVRIRRIGKGIRVPFSEPVLSGETGKLHHGICGDHCSGCTVCRLAFPCLARG